MVSYNERPPISEVDYVETSVYSSRYYGLGHRESRHTAHV